MAEVMLLLVFCLLLALATLLKKERAERIQAQEQVVKVEDALAQANSTLDRESLARKSADRLFKLVEESPQLHEALKAKTGSSGSDEISEFWRKLVESDAAIEELEHSGISRSDVRQTAKYLKDAKALGVQPSDMKHNADLVAKIREKFNGRGEATDERIITAVGQGLTKSPSESGHHWPPIIKLSEANGYYFDSGKATLKPAFESAIRGPVVAALLKTAEEYDVDVIEVVGHTDEQPIGSRASNLDKELLNALANPAAIERLVPADNAGLGLARAISVVGVLKGDDRLSRYKVLPLSGAQLIHTDETLARGLAPEDVKERRRIEIRLRKSTPATEPSPAIQIPTAVREGLPDRNVTSSIPKKLPAANQVPKRTPRPQISSPALPKSDDAPLERSISSAPPSLMDRIFGNDPAGH
jgi:outer membrane protein OmpA-like peptidoglycan-associated protein